MIVQAMPYPATGGGAFAATITIPSGKVASNLTDFPVYLKLADLPSGFWSAVASDGGNIRIKQSGSVIPFEVVVIDAGAQAGIIYFKAATLNSASDNVFTLDLSGSALLAATDTNGRNNVWTKFDRVFSFENNEKVDRTGSGATASLVGGATVAGGVLTVDGDGDLLRIGATPSTTISVLISSTYSGGATNHRNLASYLDAYTGTPVRVGLALRLNSGYHWATWNPTDSWLQDTGSSPTIGVHYNSALVHTGGGTRGVYVNGSLLISGAASSLSMGSTPIFALGFEDTTFAEEYAGTYDFAAFATVALTADFIAAWHSNRNAPASFYTIS